MAAYVRGIANLINQGNFTAPEVDMTGKTVAITGTSVGGIGFEMAKGLARMGAEVLLLNRNMTKGEETKCAILAEHPESKVRLFLCDVQSLKSVRGCIKELGGTKLDVLISNAGSQHESLAYTEDGCEVTFATLCLGHHLLAVKLMPRRLVWISGDIYCIADPKAIAGPKCDTQDAIQRYCLGSMARMWLARMWQKNGGQEMVTVHPGVIATEFVKAKGFARWLQEKIMIDCVLGAQPGIYAATCPGSDIPDHPIPYFHNKHGWYALDEDDKAMDEGKAQALWEELNTLCGLHCPDNNN
uniref:Protochlorophyllide reductase n=1 Tax=Hemiselmis tepida TaxID=464990 RepID=A0A7S0YN63_9CRYP